jgi:hypothetical protein
MLSRELLDILAEENKTGKYIHFRHTTAREINYVDGVFYSSRGTVRHNTNHVIPEGTRFNVQTYSRTEMTGHIPCYDGILYVRIKNEDVIDHCPFTGRRRA